jgi:hypothetical protein
MQKSGRPVPRRGLREGYGGVGIQSQRIRGGSTWPKAARRCYSHLPQTASPAPLALPYNQDNCPLQAHDRLASRRPDRFLSACTSVKMNA